MRQVILLITCFSYIFLIGTSLVQAHRRLVGGSRDRDLTSQEQYDNGAADILEILQQRLDEDDRIENTKRTIDLGISRGFSGSQAAKHLMGLAAANYASGPGRKRRSVRSPATHMTSEWQ